MSGFKDSVRKIIPVRASVFAKYRQNQERQLSALHEEIESVSEDIASCHELLDSVERRVDSIESHIGSMLVRFDSLDDDLKEHGRAMAQATAAVASQVDATAKTIRLDIEKVSRQTKEITWAEIYNQTIKGSDWLGDISLSPGRWAVGYQFLYVLYRTLNDVRPRSILETGLGQPSAVIAKYASSHPGVKHIVVEHDPEWIRFFERSHHLPETTEIKRLDLCFVEMANEYGCGHKVRAYDAFLENVGSTTYDLIVIDGPLGADMKDYARIDVLDLIPGNLSPSFVIIVDDYNRRGEQNMVKALEDRLRAAEIDYVEGAYWGEKCVLIICSPDYAFLRSM